MTAGVYSIAGDPIALNEALSGIGAYAPHLLRISLECRGYSRDAALALLSAAKGSSGESWAERCLAILLMEGQLLRLAPDDLVEFDLILVELGLKEENGIDKPVKAAVASEGFTTPDLRGFVGELLQRLGRLARVHRSISGDAPAWRYFFRAAREASKLTLARYIFTAEETYREIVRELRITRGSEDAIGRIGTQAAAHWTQEPLDAPDFEREILSKLCADRRIYWVSPQCGSELNTLVEYPLTSAVLAIKPPGSDAEIEIKRAGTRGERLLSVIRERNGQEAPASHRLFGGSLGWLAERETCAGRIFSRIYRLVHGVEGPCSLGVQNSSIVTVPGAGGETHILDYLTDAEQFGAGFDETRASMGACVESFPWDTGVAPASYRGEAGVTLQFIGQALPQQAIIFGSSSFRLDRVASYLSDGGPEEYFQTGLGRGYTLQDARWLADSVLEEILGQVVLPLEGFHDYSQYLRDAFRVPQNRERADSNYLSVMRQIGECWGTLLAVRGFSDGESFVLRNVGLKNMWKDGAWRIRVIFMDHDDLTVAGSRYGHLWPWREASGMERDQIHILGGPMGGDVIPGEAGALRSIYRVSQEIGDAGIKALEDATCAAYRHTQGQLESNAELQGVFYARFIQGHRDFDDLVPWFQRTDPLEIESWKQEALAYLKGRGYEDELAGEYVKTVSHFRAYFERMSFLYCR